MKKIGTGVFMAILVIFQGLLVSQAIALEVPFNRPDPFGYGALMFDRSERGPASQIKIKISEGKEPVAVAKPVVPAPATPLSDEDAETLLNKLPPPKSEAQDEKDFSISNSTAPPPIAGSIVSAAFPPPEKIEPPKSDEPAPLEVLRRGPVGDLAEAGDLTVTFSQPMVPLSSQADAIALKVPVKLTPHVAGQWRWAGTQTLIFEPVPRFPMATEFKVEIPAGAKSAVGGILSAGTAWRFKTLPLKMVRTLPGGNSTSTDPLMFIAFNQRIDPAKVLRSIRVSSGKTVWKTRIATNKEIKADSSVGSLVDSLEKDSWIAFKIANPKKVFPLDTPVRVTVDRGAPSAEGPLKSAGPQDFFFKTHGPLRVVRQECGGAGRCTPSSPIEITLNNDLDETSFKPDQVRVDPEIPGMNVECAYKRIVIRGAKQPHTEYRVTLKTALRDKFKQNLEKESQFGFHVQGSPARLFSQDFGLAILDPYAGPHFPVYSLNHTGLKVRVHSVGPEHWAKHSKDGFNARYHFSGELADLPGTPVLTKIVTIQDQTEKLVETVIDLTPVLRDGFGNFLVVVEPYPAPRYPHEKVVTWVEVTGIGLEAFAARGELLVRATSLKDGKPLEGVEIALHDEKIRDTTTADGLARLPFLAGIEPNPQWVVSGRKGADTAILPRWTYSMGQLGFSREKWALLISPYSRRQALACSNREPRQEKLAWLVFDDRGLYRPGEEVHVKGWLRFIGCGPNGDVGLVGDRIKTVNYTLADANDEKILSGTCEVDPSGGFDTVLKLPMEINLGQARLQLSVEAPEYPEDDLRYHHWLSIEEFRRPEFEVSTAAGAGNSFIGEKAEVTATASYFAGGALPGARVSWHVNSELTSYTPPNRSDFTFGGSIPYRGHYGKRRDESLTLEGTTDGTGKHTIRLDFEPSDSAAPVRVVAEAAVEDVNRQEWSSSSTILVHPADLYVGLKSPRLYARKDQPLTVQCIVTDLDGKAVPGREVRLTAVQTMSTREGGQWVEKEMDRREQTIRSGSEAVECRFEPTGGSRYRVTATVEDDRHRKNGSELVFRVAESDSVPERDLKKEEAIVIPDLKEYRPGQTAELLVQAPFHPAEGLLTLRRDGLVRAERVRIEEASSIIRIPIEETFTPNVFVQLDLTGAAVRTDEAGEPDERLPKRPAYASGGCELSIPPQSRKLLVQAVPREKILEPGGTTTVDIEVKDANGNPLAGSEVALVGVDEAVLGLVEYKIDDPLERFYPLRVPGVSESYLRDAVLLADPAVFSKPGKDTPDSRALAFMNEYSPRHLEAMMDKEESIFMKHMKNGDGKAPGDVHLRTDLNPLAFFHPAIITDNEGRARIEVKLPDNLTRYRVSAVAVAGGRQFGMGESAITARLPLMVRPSAPRFLNFGDRFLLPAVVQNQTDSPMEVKVAVRSSNAGLAGTHGLSVTVPANDRVEVRFPAESRRPGTARFQLVAKAEEAADAAEISLPVYTPATTEAFATYGQIDEGAIVQPVQAPSNVVREFGSLEIETSSTQLQALTDALLYLASYPFECAEQRSSRIIAVATLGNVLSAFKAEGLPSPKEMTAAVDLDVKRLGGMQNEDGGFSFWRADGQSDPYLSVHVAHALQRAKNAGFDVPESMLEKSAKYLKEIEKRIPDYYGVRARNAVIAYSLYVRNLMGSRDVKRARKLISDSGLDSLSIESAGWLLSVLSGDPGSSRELAAIRKHLANHTAEEAGTAHFVSSYGGSGYLLMHSDRRSDGVILDALITDQPKNDLIPKVVRGLLAHRKKGRWDNTQENAFVLIALNKYFTTYESLPPDFRVQAWIGNGYAGSAEFRGYSTERHQIKVPMNFLADAPGPVNLLLNKEGTGRLYFRLGLKFASSDLMLEPTDRGFKVERTYEAVDNTDDVRREADGSWRIKQGAKVRVHLKMANSSRRVHVALVDHLPAGFEPLNPSLSRTAAIPRDPAVAEYGYHRFGWWYDHQNLRDERVEAFTSLLWSGVYNYSYVARATTPGEFIAPPAKAEEMYHPETFGRGASERVVIQ